MIHEGSKFGTIGREAALRGFIVSLPNGLPFPFLSTANLRFPQLLHKKLVSGIVNPASFSRTILLQNSVWS